MGIFRRWTGPKCLSRVIILQLSEIRLLEKASKLNVFSHRAVQAVPNHPTEIIFNENITFHTDFCLYKSCRNCKKSVFLTKKSYVFPKFCSHIERFWSENSFPISTCPYLNIIWRINSNSLSPSLLMGKDISRIFKSLNMVVSKRFTYL